MTGNVAVTTVAPKTRLYFFDSLRTLMVLFVVIFHAAMPYVMHFAPFWPYRDPKPSFVLDMLVALVDVFNMPIFF